jgi:hypothetical protein
MIPEMPVQPVYWTQFDVSGSSEGVVASPTTLHSRQLTRANGDGSLATDGWLREGLLKYVGYSVGKKSETARFRRRMLAEIFCGPIPPVFPKDYQKEWGDPGSVARLRKLAESIAAFARNAKRKKSANMQAAVQDWEADLEFLYDEYYCGKFNFGWPDISV